MKTDFNVHVCIDLGVTPELIELVTAVIGRRQTQAAAEPRKSGMPLAHERKAEAMPEPTPEPEPDSAAQDGKPDNRAEELDSRAGKDEPTQADPEKPKELTEQDIREAMHRARQRIEGENYKDETDGELYKKYHRQLTAQFKNIAAVLGADKPSALPAEQRAAFIEECDKLRITDDGTVGSDVPF